MTLNPHSKGASMTFDKEKEIIAVYEPLAGKGLGTGVLVDPTAVIRTSRLPATDKLGKNEHALVIVADDMGFSDIGRYGGEILTPNLDTLAAEGLRFTQFYNPSRCWASRASIFTGYYPTRCIADHSIKCLTQHAEKFSSQPLFEYLAFTAPHFPLQALPKDIALCKDRYQAGWDTIRQERLARMKKLGVVDCGLSTLEPAAMVNRMDIQIGRVLEQLKTMGALSNTLVMFVSDNAASSGKILRGDGNNASAAMGSAKSYLGLGPGWASASNTPFRLHKSWTHEGGITTPLIVDWPAGIPAHGKLRHDPGHLIDLLPTALEVTGATRPAEVAGLPVPPPPGKSLPLDFAKDGSIKRDPLWFYQDGNRDAGISDYTIHLAAGPDAIAATIAPGVAKFHSPVKLSAGGSDLILGGAG